MMLKCECGGRLRPAILAHVDFSSEVGLPVTLQSVPGWQCTKCGGQTLQGKVFAPALYLIACEILRLPTLLDQDAARYLRRYLGLRQRDLADRMGVARETVAAWECGQSPISPQHDLILRGLTVGHLAGRETPSLPREDLELALGSVRKKQSRRRRRIVITDLRRRLKAA